ncbi:MAG: DUF1194 domain-containing protein [Pseudomonadota bacterium]
MIRCIFLAALLWADVALATCRQALVLGLDVSGSVDAQEYRLQIDGVAAALQDEAVTAALLATPGAVVQFAVFEWSGSAYQRLIIPWTAIEDTDDIARIAAVIRGWRRPAAPPQTGLGQAMIAGADLLRAKPECWRRTLDISGDGKGNEGPAPQAAGVSDRTGDITINALVIGKKPDNSSDRRQADIAELTAYFQSEVIRGPNAFTEVALGFEDYAAAMRRKLLRELATAAIGTVEPAPELRRFSSLHQ